MNLRTITALAFLLVTPATAAEFDFAVQLVDLDKNPIRDCPSQRVIRTDPNNLDCSEWNYHTLGLISFAALDQPEECKQGKLPLDCAVAQSRRGALARKIYPGKEEKHVVELSTSDITLILEGLSKLSLRSIEMVQVIEILDPARLK